MKNKTKKRSCPYCKSKVSYIRALSEVSLGEHTCPVCNKNSNISYSKKIYIPAAVALAAAIAITAILFVKGNETRIIWTCVVIIIPFALFYFLSPLFYILSPIRSQSAVTPVIKQKQVSRKRSELTPRAVKYEEKKRIEREKKSMEKKQNSFKSKLTRFVKTYIVVDEEENSTSMPQNEPTAYEPTDGKTRIAKAIKEENIDEIKRKLADEKKSKQNDYNYDSYDDYDDYSNTANDDNYTDNTKYYRKDNTNYDEDDPFNETNEEDLSVVASVSADIPFRYEHIERKPVYHKLNKKTNVSFVYLPENIDFIEVDLNKKTEEEEENEEILSFFAQTPNNSQTEYSVFGVKQEDTDIHKQASPLPDITAEIEKVSEVSQTEVARNDTSDFTEGDFTVVQAQPSQSDEMKDLPQNAENAEKIADNDTYGTAQENSEQPQSDEAADEIATAKADSDAEQKIAEQDNQQSKIKITRVFSLTDEERELAAKENILRFDYFPDEKRTIAVSLDDEPAQDKSKTEIAETSAKVSEDVSEVEEKANDTQVNLEQNLPDVPDQDKTEKTEVQKPDTFPQENAAAVENSDKITAENANTADTKSEIDVQSIDGIDFINFFDGNYDDIVMEIADEDLSEESFSSQTSKDKKATAEKPCEKNNEVIPQKTVSAQANEEAQSEKIILPTIGESNTRFAANTDEEKVPSQPLQKPESTPKIADNTPQNNTPQSTESSPIENTAEKKTAEQANNSKIKTNTSAARMPYEKVYSPTAAAKAPISQKGTADKADIRNNSTQPPQLSTETPAQAITPPLGTTQEQPKIQRRHRDYNKDKGTQNARNRSPLPPTKKETFDNNISASVRRSAAPIKLAGEPHAEKPVKSVREEKPTETGKLEKDIKDENISFQQMIDLSEFQTSGFTEDTQNDKTKSKERSIDITIDDDYEEDEEFSFEREISPYEDDEDDYDNPTPYPYDMHGQASASYIPLNKKEQTKNKGTDNDKKSEQEKKKRSGAADTENKGTSRYEKRFGTKNTTKAKTASDNGGAIIPPAKKQRTPDTVKNTVVTPTEKPLNISNDNGEKKEKVGFFAGLKEKIIAATEQEREEEYEREEKERKLAEKEARKRAKEKAKLAESKNREKSAKSASEKKAEPASKQADSRTANRNSQNDSQVHKQNNPHKQETPRSKYEEQEKIILASDSVKSKIAAQTRADNRKITEEEKQRRIAGIQRSEQNKSAEQRKKAEKENLRRQKESKLYKEEQYRENEEKVEQLRRQQEAKAKARQRRIKESDGEQRSTDDMNLTEIDKVRTKVSQQQKQKQKKIDEFFSE